MTPSSQLKKRQLQGQGPLLCFSRSILCGESPQRHRKFPALQLQGDRLNRSLGLFSLLTLYQFLLLVL